MLSLRWWASASGGLIFCTQRCRGTVAITFVSVQIQKRSCLTHLCNTIADTVGKRKALKDYDISCDQWGKWDTTAYNKHGRRKRTAPRNRDGGLWKAASRQSQLVGLGDDRGQNKGLSETVVM